MTHPTAISRILLGTLSIAALLFVRVSVADGYDTTRAHRPDPEETPNWKVPSMDFEEFVSFRTRSEPS